MTSSTDSAPASNPVVPATPGAGLPPLPVPAPRGETPGNAEPEAPNPGAPAPGDTGLAPEESVAGEEDPGAGADAPDVPPPRR